MANYNGYIIESFGDIYYGSMELSPTSSSVGFIDEATDITVTFTNPTELTIVLNTII